jgi:hypothetical protein
LNHRVFTEPADRGSGFRSYLRPEQGVGEALQPVDELIHPAGLEQESIAPRLNNLPHRADIARDQRRAHRQRLKRRKGEGFELAAEHADIDRGQEGAHVTLIADEHDRVGQPQSLDLPLDGLALRTLANHQQFRRHAPRLQLGQRIDQIAVAFLGPQGRIDPDHIVVGAEP